MRHAAQRDARRDLDDSAQAVADDASDVKVVVAVGIHLMPPHPPVSPTSPSEEAHDERTAPPALCPRSVPARGVEGCRRHGASPMLVERPGCPKGRASVTRNRRGALLSCKSAAAETDVAPRQQRQGLAPDLGNGDAPALLEAALRRLPRRRNAQRQGPQAAHDARVKPCGAERMPPSSRLLLSAVQCGFAVRPCWIMGVRISHPSWCRPDDCIGRRAEVPLLVLRRRLPRGSGHYVVVLRGRLLGHGRRRRILCGVVGIVLPLVCQAGMQEQPALTDKSCFATTSLLPLFPHPMILRCRAVIAVWEFGKSGPSHPRCRPPRSG